MKLLFPLFMMMALLLPVSSLQAANVEQVWQLDEKLDGKGQPSGAFFAKSIKRLSALPGFQCDFDQSMVFSDGGRQVFSGEVAILKPKRFRWSYRQPYEQLYIGDASMI